jgi:hypothetical protein
MMDIQNQKQVGPAIKCTCDNKHCKREAHVSVDQENVVVFSGNPWDRYNVYMSPDAALELARQLEEAARMAVGTWSDLVPPVALMGSAAER